MYVQQFLYSHIWIYICQEPSVFILLDIFSSEKIVSLNSKLKFVDKVQLNFGWLKTEETHEAACASE
jgi:hypothetical protein